MYSEDSYKEHRLKMAAFGFSALPGVLVLLALTVMWYLAGGWVYRIAPGMPTLIYALGVGAGFLVVSVVAGCKVHDAIYGSMSEAEVPLGIAAFFLALNIGAAALLMLLRAGGLPVFCVLALWVIANVAGGVFVYKK